MRHRTQLPQTLDFEVISRDEPPEAAKYAQSKIGELSHYTSRPLRHARVKLGRHRDPAIERPVIAQANVDVDGTPIRAQVQAATAREAVDLVAARLRRRLERATEQREPRRGQQCAANSQEWRHDSGPTHRPNHFPRPIDERRVMRRKSFTMAPCTIDEAAREMDLLDYDFHLFTEKGSGAAAVLYRAGETGYRLALVTPAAAEQLCPHALPVTISLHSIPCLTEEEAAQRLSLLGLPFLFFIDAAWGCASVLYHRYDGHYGVITPAG